MIFHTYRFIKKYAFILFACVVFIQFVFIVFLNRAVVFESYDISYWKDRFEHSQWQLPLSRRTIGDDALFAHVGYEIANGKDPTYVSAEVPPVGKYLIGWSISYFGHFVWYTLFIGLLSIFIYFIITTLLVRNITAGVFAGALLLFDPLFFSQFTVSLLDLTQLFFFLLTILFALFAVRTRSKAKMFLLGLSGVSLGVMVQVKVPLLVPIIGILLLVYFWKEKIRYSIFIFIIGSVIGFILPYTGYFLQGNTFGDFIGVIRYTVGFYRGSGLDVSIGSILRVLFTGYFPHITEKTLTPVSEWWILWPISIGIAIFVLIKKAKKLSIEMTGLLIFTVSSLVIYSFIPSYPRYLLLIMPFVYIFVAYELAGKKKVFTVGLMLLILYGFSNAYYFNHLQKENEISSYFHSFSHQFFQDVYHQFILKENIGKFSRETFHNTIRSDLRQAQVRHISFSEHDRDIPLFGEEGHMNATVTYYTQHLGMFSEQKTIPLVREQGKWLVDWNWDLIVNGYKPGYVFESEIVRGKRGSINQGKNVLAEDKEGYLISILPDEIDYEVEDELLEKLSEVTSIKSVHIQNAYLEDPHGQLPIPIASNTREIDENEFLSLTSYSGVYLTPYTTRVYNGLSPQSITNQAYEECCTRFYSATNYEGDDSFEKEFNNQLKGQDGGGLLLQDEQNNTLRVILEKEPINGTDVIL